jgi:hypothetical protein
LIAYDQLIAEGVANARAAANRNVEGRFDDLAAFSQDRPESLVDVIDENVRLGPDVQMYDQFRIRLWKFEADRLVRSPHQAMAEFVPIERNGRFKVGCSQQVTVDFSE